MFPGRYFPGRYFPPRYFPQPAGLTTFGRGWPSAMYDALGERVRRLAWAIKAELDSGDLLYWTGYGDLPFGGDTYIGAGHLIGFSPVTESQDVKASGLVISLSGVSDSLVALQFTEEYQGRPCTVYQCMFDENMVLLADPQPVFSGRIDTIESDPILREDGTTSGKASYAMTVESHAVDLRTARPRYYTSEDQQAFYPGDTFFDRVPQLQNARVIWGRA